MSLCIGLTGGIGCGKSTVAELFAHHGACVIDTDAISHQLTQQGGNAIKAIRDTFGDSYITPDGALDRVKMRNLIFSDPNAKQCLEQLLHPMILLQAQSLLRQQLSCPYTILIVPLLPVTPDFLNLVQRVLVVDCGEQNQIERVINRNGMIISEVRTIISQQPPRADMLKMADDVIYNNEDMFNLRNQVKILHNQYAHSKNGN
jgi:dephospho-CoA kinase